MFEELNLTIIELGGFGVVITGLSAWLSLIPNLLTQNADKVNYEKR